MEHLMSNTVQKYMGAFESYQSFIQSCKKSHIDIKDNKIHVLKGRLAERIVSREIAAEKISVVDYIKDLFASIFSRDYIQAKKSIRERLPKYIANYNEQIAILHKNKLKKPQDASSAFQPKSSQTTAKKTGIMGVCDLPKEESLFDMLLKMQVEDGDSLMVYDPDKDSFTKANSNNKKQEKDWGRGQRLGNANEKKDQKK